MISTHSRGHKVIYVNYQWLYADDNTPANIERKCKRCGKMPTKEGYDACLGELKNCKSACCGHGVSKPIHVSSISGK